MTNRPEKRSDCLPGGGNSQRPCPWVSCAWHMLHVMDYKNPPWRYPDKSHPIPAWRCASKRAGSYIAKYNTYDAIYDDDKLVDYLCHMPETCVLDVCDRDSPPTLEELGVILGEISNERVRQIAGEAKYYCGDHRKNAGITLLRHYVSNNINNKSDIVKAGRDFLIPDRNPWDGIVQGTDEGIVGDTDVD